MTALGKDAFHTTELFSNKLAARSTVISLSVPEIQSPPPPMLKA
jgi:hypothetical protein